MEIPAILLPFMVYSFFCAPHLVFRLFPSDDTMSPEYAFLYLVGCIFLGFSGIAGAVRIGYAIAGKKYS